MSFGFLKVVLYANWGYFGYLSLLVSSHFPGSVGLCLWLILETSRAHVVVFFFFEIITQSLDVLFCFFFNPLFFHANLARKFFVFNAFCSYRYQALMSFSFLASVSFEFDFDRIWLKKKYKCIFCLKTKRWNLKVPDMRRNFISRGMSELMSK